MTPNVRFWRPLLWAWAVCLCWLGLTVGAAAQSATGDTPRFGKDFVVGFQDFYHLGRWIPLELELIGGRQHVQGQVIIESPDGESYPTHLLVDRPIDLPPGAKRTVRAYVLLGSAEEGLRATFHYRALEGGPQRSTHMTARPHDNDWPLVPPLDPRQPLTLVVGRGLGFARSAEGEAWDPYAADPQEELDVTAVRPRWPDGQEPAVVEPLPIDDLPDRWFGYDAVDLLVLPAQDALNYAQLSDAQRDAILEWVARGGRVLIAGGGTDPRLLEPNGLLGQLLPGRFDRPFNLIEGRGFEQFVPGEGQLPLSRDDPAVVAVLDDVRGEVVARDGSIPLVIRGRYGFGSVTYVAINLNEPVLARWSDRDAFLRKLTGWRTETGGGGQRGMRYGYHAISDMTSDLIVGLERFEGIPVIPFSLVAVLIGGYILWIGPLDYFIVRHVFKRMTLTWVTFPLIVVVVSFGCYWLAAYIKGDKVRINQASLLDVDLSSGRVRATSWINLYSPDTRRYNLRAEPSAALPVAPLADDAVQLAWLGRPEAYGLGGMGGSGTLLSFGRSYEIDPESPTLAPVPLQIASTRPFLARWAGQLADPPATLFDVRLETDPRPDGVDLLRLELTSQLPESLTGCGIAYRHHYFPLPNLEPGQPVRLDLRGERQERLFSALSAKGAGSASYDEYHQHYSPGNVGIESALGAMMFFRMAGSEDFTGLSNNFQSAIDLSGVLEAGHAVLLAKIAEPPTQLNDEARPFEAEQRQVTFLRVVLPLTTDAP